MTQSLVNSILKSSIIVIACFLSACSSIQKKSDLDKIDPFEPMNRAVFAFNEKADDYVIKPLAKGYRFILPTFAQTGVTNFFGNINELITAANNLLQGDPERASNDIGRFLINTSIGVFGLFDVATDLGIDRNKEDFGQTLGVWGVPSGPYVVLPFFGPSSARDAVGFFVDINSDIVLSSNKLTSDQKLTSTVLRVVNERARLLDATKLLDDAAFDKYSFIRDGYLQRRRNQIHNGNPPLAIEED
jgi:phospholipid-binding lipoprotein MlaA